MDFVKAFQALNIAMTGSNSMISRVSNLDFERIASVLGIIQKVLEEENNQ